ncbi:hypothetical protein [Streptomyces sp. NPDC057877]|uniref:hypothetical protein n=1 Tax=Streptomyces sp. NPDC057877 TaxID=3346269 RepID=UPI0036A0C76D
MSATEAEPGEQATDPEDAGEPGVSERTARLILAAVLLLAMWGIVAVLPETAYVVVGVLACLAWQRARRWLAGRRSGAEAGESEPDRLPLAEADVVQALHRFAAPHVFLSALAAELDLSMEATRAVLEALDIRVRRAVRVGDTTGVGVHKDDIPPLPQPLSGTPVEGVDQGQPTNQQAGVRIERTEGGLIIYDLADNHRHHTVDHP